MHASLIAAMVLAASPRVSEVVVYPDRAQVTRVAEHRCGERGAVLFEGIPPAADAATLRAAAKGATVEGLRSEQRTREKEFSPELEKLHERRRELLAEQQAVSDALERTGNAGELGAQYEQVAVTLISRDMAIGAPDPKGWSKAFALPLQAKLDAAAKLVELNAKAREIGRQLEELNGRIGRLQAAAGAREYVAEVLVRCPAGRTAQVELTYVVGGASWSPAYEARAEEAKGRVELATYATVKQATGEAWKGARLLLSTAVPSQDATPPEIRRMEVGAQKREDVKKVLVRRDEVVQHARVGSAAAPAQQAGLQAVSQGLSVQLVVPDRSDVPGDGSPVRLFVARTQLPGTFVWRTVPSMVPFVFRVAEVTNAAPFPLLAGPLDAFGRSGFIGRYPIERTPQGGHLQLTFGVEEQLSVKRVVLEEVKRDAGIFGQNRRFRYGYRIELANWGKAPMGLEVIERVPVSELADVKVTIDPKTSRPYELDASDGLLTWKVKLAPSEKRELVVGFSVDVPGSYDLGGL